MGDVPSTEMAIHPDWKDRICRATDVDAVKVPHAERVMPPFTLPQLGQPMTPRSLRTCLVDQLEHDPDSVDPATIGPELLAAVRAGGGHELLPFAGQSVALVHDILPTAELVTRLLTEAEEALARVWAGADRRRPSSASHGRTSSRP